MDNNDRYSLHYLVGSDDNVAIVRDFLERGTNPNLKNLYGETLLHAAAMSKEDNPEVVRVLINAGADVRRVNKLLDTPLHYAVFCRKREVVDLLLRTNIDINGKNVFFNTALHYAADMLHYINGTPLLTPPPLWLLKKFLDHPHIKVDVFNKFGETPLVLAIKQNRLDIIKMLLKKNASLDTDDMNRHNTPLHEALRNPDSYVIVALLLKKANILKLNKDGKSPLEIIIKMPSVGVAKVYLKVIAFNYNLKEVLENKIESLELSQFLKRCWDEISCMKSDIIVNDFTVFDFFSKINAKSGFDNPILQIYKPVIERLVIGLYPEYFCYILKRITKSTLTDVLEIIINQKYFNIETDAVNGWGNYLTDFLQIVRLGLLAKYLTCLDIFILIVVFTNTENEETMLDFRNHECYLTDLWDQYCEHFQ